MPKQKSSVYPARPKGSEVIATIDGNNFGAYDSFVVAATSLFFVGSVFWVPALYTWALKRLRSIPREQVKRRALYTTILLSATALFCVGPHRRPEVGKRLKFHDWSIWKSWLRFFAFEVVADQGSDSFSRHLKEQAIVAVSPHGIFPFGLAFAALGESQKYFGKFRAVVASATQMIPWVRDILRWIESVYVCF